MKKRITAIVLAALLACGIVACGSGSVASTGGSGSANSTTEAEEPEEEIPEIPLTQGEATVDVGDFTVLVPEGWLGAGDIDVNMEGKYFIEPYYYFLIKGGESANDQGIKPTISIYYSSDMDAQEQYDTNLYLMDEYEELDVTVGGQKCLAYHSKMIYSDDPKNEIIVEYDYVFIPVSDSSCLRIIMKTFETSGGYTGISVEDKDVIAILESLKVK